MSACLVPLRETEHAGMRVCDNRGEHTCPAGMSFELTEDQEMIRKSVAELAGKFDDQYWMKKDLAHEFPRSSTTPSPRAAGSA